MTTAIFIRGLDKYPDRTKQAGIIVNCVFNDAKTTADLAAKTLLRLNLAAYGYVNCQARVLERVAAEGVPRRPFPSRGASPRSASARQPASRFWRRSDFKAETGLSPRTW